MYYDPNALLPKLTKNIETSEYKLEDVNTINFKNLLRGALTPQRAPGYNYQETTMQEENHLKQNETLNEMQV